VEIQKRGQSGQPLQVSSHTFICRRVTLEDDVFIGHNVTFITTGIRVRPMVPASCRRKADWSCVRRGSGVALRIGSGATLLCGVTIGEKCFGWGRQRGDKDVPAGATWPANPARVGKSARTKV